MTKSTQENETKIVSPEPTQKKYPWMGLLFGASLALLLVVFFIGGAAVDRAFDLKQLDVLLQPLERPDSPPVNSTSLGSVIEMAKGSGSVADVVEAAGPSVVTVAVKTQQPVYQQVPGVFPGFNFRVPSGQLEEIQRDIGTGFVVDTANGFIVTNKHVVEALDVEYQVIDAQDKEYSVTNIYRDPSYDLAILKVESIDLPPLAMGDSDTVRVGDGVIAIGTALGEFRNTVTTGVISGKGRGIEASSGYMSDTERLSNVFQTDAAINPGNSGGPLIGYDGKVIGVNVAMTQGAQNIAFSIPINEVKSVLGNFNSTGQFDRARLGVEYQTITARAALLNEWPQGAYITAVVPESPAAKAGVQQDDIIFQIDDKSLTGQELVEVINAKKPGDTVKLKIWRNDEELEVSATLESATAQ